MGMSSKEFLRVDEETSGCTRGGARFRQEKRQRTWEGPVVIKMQYHEEKPHVTK